MTSKNAANATANIAFLTFISLGLTSGLLGVAWPSIQKDFHLPLDGVNVLIFGQTLVYSLVGFYIGRLMTRLGSGNALLAGAVLLALSMFGIAVSQTWLVVIAFALVFGLGSGIVDAGLNMYVATYLSARQMSWLHACFGVGVAVGPLLMTFVVSQPQLGWHIGYGVTGVVVLVIVALVALTRRQWRIEGFQTSEKQPVRRAHFGETLRLPVVWFSMATFVTYVGTEIGLGQWAYTVLTESRNMPPEVAGPWLSLYWTAFTGGRFLFGIIANRFEIKMVLRYCMVGMIVGAFLFWWNPVTAVGLLGLLVIGFSQAPVFPMLMSDTPRRVGVEHAENTISLQMGAVGIGAALLPGLIGTIGKNFGLETIAASFFVTAILVFICHEFTTARGIERPVPVSAGD